MEGDSTASGHGDHYGVVKNENDWGLSDEVLEDLAVASHAASARGGAGASHALHNSHSAARVPSIIRTGGARSISSRSVVATGNYFDGTARCSCHVISARKVICPKNKRGVQGLRGYSQCHEAATTALPKLFGAAKHYRTKNADSELSYKYKDIQSEYVGNLDKLKLFTKQMEAFDMLNPFLISIWMNPMAISLVNHWGDSKSEAVDLTKHWLKISLKHACAWQRDTFDWCTENKWGANGGRVNPRNNESSADGVEERNGTWMMNCKSCGWNDTHMSGYHGEWSRNQSTFQLLGTHIFWSKSGTTPSVEKSPAPASSLNTPGVSKGQLSGLIGHYKTETDDGAFPSFLLEFEGLLKWEGIALLIGVSMSST
jgi:hypothetical protein